MTREFKLGDEVIMTVDSSKGRVNKGWNDGEYNGMVTSLEESDMVRVEFPEYTNVYRFDRTTLGRDEYPGMSIRHADEVGVVSGIYPTGLHTHELPTPQKQEWVKGQAPAVGERKGAIWIYKYGWEKPLYYTTIEKIDISAYTHWQYVQLPSPPPAEEVEAYGMLEAIDKIWASDIIVADRDVVLAIKKAKNFFSLPATAENLEKYILDVYDNSIPAKRAVCHMTLDQFINWYKREYTSQRLIFTAAALEALGVK